MGAAQGLSHSTSGEFARFCQANGDRASVGRTGGGWDNAAASQQLKDETYHRQAFPTKPAPGSPSPRRVSRGFASKVAATLAAQDVTVPAEAATGHVISELAGDLVRVSRRHDALTGEIEEAFLAHPFGGMLASMPGIGPRTGARILAEIGGGSAFATAASWPPMPAWPRSPASSSPSSRARPAGAAATATMSCSPCSAPASTASPHPHTELPEVA